MPNVLYNFYYLNSNIIVQAWSNVGDALIRMFDELMSRGSEVHNDHKEMGFHTD